MASVPYQRLTATDASWLYIESSHEPQHVGSLSYLEGAPLRDASGRIAIDELRSSALRRLHRVPVLRQRLMFVPYGLGQPIWVDDDQFDIGYHIRLTAVPRPGADDQVHELMGQLQSLPLDRQRPLWEMWFVDGLQDDEVGLIIKSHHALGDGIATVDVALAFVDFEPDPPEEPPAPAWEPEPAPSASRLLLDSVAGQLVRPTILAERGLAPPGAGALDRDCRRPSGDEPVRPSDARAVERAGHHPSTMGQCNGAPRSGPPCVRPAAGHHQRCGARGVHGGAA